MPTNVFTGLIDRGCHRLHNINMHRLKIKCCHLGEEGAANDNKVVTNIDNINYC